MKTLLRVGAAAFFALLVIIGVIYILIGAGVIR